MPARCGGSVSPKQATETHNATKLNNAQWRWFRPGQRNPPVKADTRPPRRFTREEQFMGGLVSTRCQFQSGTTSKAASVLPPYWGRFGKEAA